MGSEIETIYSGNDYRDLIQSFLVTKFCSRGLRVYKEITFGTNLLGKKRRVDLFCISNNKALIIECKYQQSNGTAEEKLYLTLQDLNTLNIPSVLVFGGSGYSSNMLHMLRTNRNAVFFDPKNNTKELIDYLAATFEWWDLIVGDS